MRVPPQFRWKPVVLPLLVLASAVPLTALARQIQQVPPAINRQSPTGGISNQAPEPTTESLPLKLEHMREDDRRKRLLNDTARLVDLSNELKTEVDKSSRDELSLDVIRKAAEIEKLAHDVRERMKS